MRFCIDHGFERDELPSGVVVLEWDRLDAAHEVLKLHAIFDQVGNRADLQVVPLCKGSQVGQPCNASVFAQNLDDQTGRLESCQASQIHTGFRMAGAHEHTTLS